ncbi:MAG: T9SS type A sorting domain-containing protein [Bacteroidota bacterium]
MSQPTSLSGTLDLTLGNLTTTAANLLTIADDATAINASASSLVNGPLKKIGDDNFSFPVGAGSIYAPIGITNVFGESGTDEFTAEYNRANPQSTFPYSSAVQAGLNHVSYVEYWTLQQNTAGAIFKKVSLAVNTTSFCRDLDRTFVGRWNGSLWVNEGSEIISGPVTIGFNQTGTIRSDNLITGFTPPAIAFTLATDLVFADNPLPIHLISFDAVKLSSATSSVAWELAACCSSTAKFEIQRAEKSRNFITIRTMAGSETNRFYNYTDNDLQSGINYYRLKMTDADGTITYSRTVAVMNGVNGLLFTSLIPTLVTTTASLTIASSAAQKMDIVIVDMQGRVMMKRNYMIAAGNTNIELSLGGLPAGAYQLLGISAEGKTNTIRFIR